jgi:hypothetical protein
MSQKRRAIFAFKSTEGFLLFAVEQGELIDADDIIRRQIGDVETELKIIFE